MIEIIVQTSYSGMFNDIWRFRTADEMARVVIDRERLGMILRVIQISGSGMDIARYAMEMDNGDFNATAEEMHKLVTSAVWNVTQ